MVGIEDIVENEFNECLGFDYRGELEADLADYTDAQKYAVGNYAEKDIVIFEGIYYEALRATSSSPNNSEDWKTAPKFLTTCIENFWCKYLGRYLSLKVFRNSITPNSIRLSDNGLTARFGDNFRDAKTSETSAYVNWLDSQIEMVGSNMKKYVAREKEKDAPCFENFGVLEKECNCGCGSKSGHCSAQTAHTYRIG